MHSKLGPTLVLLDTATLQLCRNFVITLCLSICHSHSSRARSASRQVYLTEAEAYGGKFPLPVPCLPLFLPPTQKAGQLQIHVEVASQISKQLAVPPSCAAMRLCCVLT